MMRPGFAVTDIIPTVGLRERVRSLTAAPRSALDQAGVTTTVIVMLKGAERDAKIERALRDNMGVTLVVRDERGLPLALAVVRASAPRDLALVADAEFNRISGARSRARRPTRRSPPRAARAGERPSNHCDDYVSPFFAVGGSTLFKRRYPASWL